MNLKRFRDPLVAAVGALLVAGASVALAAGPTTPASSTPKAAVEQPSGAQDTDTLQQGDQTTSDSPADAAGTEATGAEQSAEKAGAEATTTEADGPGGHADDPNASNVDHQFEGQE